MSMTMAWFKGTSTGNMGFSCRFSLGMEIIWNHIWLVVYLPSEKYEFVSWEYYSQYIEKCSKPPNRYNVYMMYDESTVVHG